ncbi:MULTISPECIES: ribbon-helix-helix domain-containing protein [Methylococcus]|uniref:Ribbon-helix-helix domain-containing protein n=1 Tax=Methylococcus capsulatus TaxID=414 RepID=A0ABZ2F7A8_METCP|nr:MULTISPECIES: ribbon-helix-helix domain-containing protein [Methylococcus]MDF9390917.1 CopG family transcriptional regulator [Methylococcus capsulatus]
MHFNIYLDDETGFRLKSLAEAEGESRNALIRRALKEWIEFHSDSKSSGAEKSGWPQEVAAFQGMPDMEPFESHRRNLIHPAGDPLA